MVVIWPSKKDNEARQDHVHDDDARTGEEGQLGMDLSTYTCAENDD